MLEEINGKNDTLIHFCPIDNKRDFIHLVRYIDDEANIPKVGDQFSYDGKGRSYTFAGIVTQVDQPIRREGEWRIVEIFLDLFSDPTIGEKESNINIE